MRHRSNCTETLTSPLPFAIIYSSAITYFLFFLTQSVSFASEGKRRTRFRCCTPKTKTDVENENKRDQKTPHKRGGIARLGPSQRFSHRYFMHYMAAIIAFWGSYSLARVVLFHAAMGRKSAGPNIKHNRLSACKRLFCNVFPHLISLLLFIKPWFFYFFFTQRDAKL